MTNRSETPDPFSSTIAALEAKVADTLAIIEKLKRERAVHLGEPLQSASPPTATPEVGSAADEPSAPLEGPELAAAAIKQLETANCPMTARDIWAALVRAGMHMRLTMRDPAYSILVVLKRRLKTERDVVLTGYGKWALRKWYTDSEAEELDRKWGGTGGRSKTAHAEKTSTAVKEKIARGESWGRQRTVTAEHMAKAYEVIRRGGSKLAAANAAEIKHPTFAWYWMVFEMENWKPGLPFPPARRAVPLKKAPKKHEMWPNERVGFFNGNGTAKSAVPH